MSTLGSGPEKFLETILKYGFHKKSFIFNATLVSCPFPSSLLGGFMSQIYGGEILQFFANLSTIDYTHKPTQK